MKDFMDKEIIGMSYSDDPIWEEVRNEIVIPDPGKSLIFPRLTHLRERAFIWRMEALTLDKCKDVVCAVADAVCSELDRRF